MIIGGKPENVKTELGAIAICVASMVAFLSVAATTKENFHPAEWWLFICLGGFWLTWFARNFLQIHKDRFLIEAQSDQVDQYREFAETHLKALALAIDSAKTIASAGIVSKNEMPDEKETTESKDKNPNRLGSNKGKTAVE